MKLLAYTILAAIALKKFWEPFNDWWRQWREDATPTPTKASDTSTTPIIPGANCEELCVFLRKHTRVEYIEGLSYTSKNNLFMCDVTLNATINEISKEAFISLLSCQSVDFVNTRGVSYGYKELASIFGITYEMALRLLVVGSYFNLWEVETPREIVLSKLENEGILNEEEIETLLCKVASQGMIIARCD